MAAFSAEMNRELSAEMGGELGGLASLLGTGITIPHTTLVMLGYAVLFGALLYWLFLRRDID